MFALTCPLKFYQYGLIRVISSKPGMQIDSTGFVQDKKKKKAEDRSADQGLVVSNEGVTSVGHGEERVARYKRLKTRLPQ